VPPGAAQVRRGLPDGGDGHREHDHPPVREDEGRGDTDWGATGPDEATAALAFRVPEGMQTLRFTTQYITESPDQDPRDEALLQYDYRGDTITDDLDILLTLDTAIEKAGRGRTHAPISQAIDVSGQDFVRLQARVRDMGTGSGGDTALILSRVFFSGLPLPGYISGDYVPNPRSSDISSAAGTFRQQIPLLSVPGKGLLSLDFFLSYSSDRRREEQLGEKWSHSLAQTAEEFEDFDGDDCPDSVFVYLGAGAIEAFDEDPDSPAQTGGVCEFEARSEGVFSTLKVDSDFKYRHTTRNGIVSLFGEPGSNETEHLLMEKSEPNGHFQLFEYANTSDLLERVVDTRGEEYRLVYDEQADPPRLETLTAPGVQLAFAYNDQDFLESITDANGLETLFSYDQAGNLLLITDADGIRQVANDYEGFAGLSVRQTGDRVVLQRNGNPGDPGRATEFRGDALEIRDRESGLSLERYDVFGRLVEQRILLDESFDSLDDGVRQEPGSEPLDWCAINEYEYNENDQIVRRVDPRGAVTTFEYDDDGNLTCQIDDAEGLHEGRRTGARAVQEETRELGPGR